MTKSPPKSIRFTICLVAVVTLGLLLVFELVLTSYTRLGRPQELLEHQEQHDVIDVFVASVHAAKFGNPKKPHGVFFNTMLPDTNDDEEKRRQLLKFKCVSDRNEVVESTLQGVDGGINCLWKNYYFLCEFKHPTESVRMIDEQGFGPSVPVKQPIQGKIPLVVCLSRTFYYENWQVMLTVLEMYKAMGVSEFSIQILNIVKEVYEVMKLYEKEVNLKIHPGLLMPKIRGRFENPNFRTETMNQIMCYTDCLYSYREAADFMIFSDMDDLIMPENGDLLAKAEQLLHHFPKAASFEFAWAVSEFSGASNISEFSIPRLFSGFKTHYMMHYGKSIIIPKRICSGLIHDGRGESIRVPGYRNVHLNLTVEHGRALHIREMRMTEFEGKSEEKFVEMVNTTLINKKAMIAGDKAFKGRLNGKFKKAIHSLPSDLFFTPQFKQCYKKIAERDATKALCTSLNNCNINYENSPKCAAVSADHRGYVNGKVNFYVARNSRIVENTNCDLKLPTAEIIERLDEAKR